MKLFVICALTALVWSREMKDLFSQSTLHLSYTIEGQGDVHNLKSDGKAAYAVGSGDNVAGMVYDSADNSVFITEDSKCTHLHALPEEAMVEIVGMDILLGLLAFPDFFDSFMIHYEKNGNSEVYSFDSEISNNTLTYDVVEKSILYEIKDEDTTIAVVLVQISTTVEDSYFEYTTYGCAAPATRNLKTVFSTYAALTIDDVVYAKNSDGDSVNVIGDEGMLYVPDVLYTKTSGKDCYSQRVLREEMMIETCQMDVLFCLFTFPEMFDSMSTYFEVQNGLEMYAYGDDGSYLEYNPTTGVLKFHADEKEHELTLIKDLPASYSSYFDPATFSCTAPAEISMKSLFEKSTVQFTLQYEGDTPTGYAKKDQKVAVFSEYSGSTMGFVYFPSENLIQGNLEGTSCQSVNILSTEAKNEIFSSPLLAFYLAFPEQFGSYMTYCETKSGIEYCQYGDGHEYLTYNSATGELKWFEPIYDSDGQTVKTYDEYTITVTETVDDSIVDPVTYGCEVSLAEKQLKTFLDKTQLQLYINYDNKAPTYYSKKSGYTSYAQVVSGTTYGYLYDISALKMYSHLSSEDPCTENTVTEEEASEIIEGYALWFMLSDPSVLDMTGVVAVWTGTVEKYTFTEIDDYFEFNPTTKAFKWYEPIYGDDHVTVTSYDEYTITVTETVGDTYFTPATFGCTGNSPDPDTPDTSVPSDDNLRVLFENDKIQVTYSDVYVVKGDGACGFAHVNNGVVSGKIKVYDKICGKLGDTEKATCESTDVKTYVCGNDLLWCLVAFPEVFSCDVSRTVENGVNKYTHKSFKSYITFDTSTGDMKYYLPVLNNGVVKSYTEYDVATTTSIDSKYTLRETYGYSEKMREMFEAQTMQAVYTMGEEKIVLAKAGYLWARLRYDDDDDIISGTMVFDGMEETGTGGGIISTCSMDFFDSSHWMQSAVEEAFFRSGYPNSIYCLNGVEYYSYSGGNLEYTVSSKAVKFIRNGQQANVAVTVGSVNSEYIDADTIGCIGGATAMKLSILLLAICAVIQVLF